MKYLILLLLVSCTIVRVIDAKKHNKNLKHNLRKIDKFNSQIHQNLNDLRAINKRLLKYSGEFNINQEIKSLSSYKKSILTKTKDIAKTLKDSPYKKAKKIKSDKPKKFEGFKKFSTKAMIKFKAIVKIQEKYQKLSEKTAKKLKKRHSGKMKIKDVEKTVSKYRKHLRKYDSRKMNRTVMLCLGNAKTQLVNYLNYIRKENPGKKEAIVVPGMNSHNTLLNYLKLEKEMRKFAEDRDYVPKCII